MTTPMTDPILDDSSPVLDSPDVQDEGGAVDEGFLKALLEHKAEIVVLCQQQLDGGGDEESTAIAKDVMSDEIGEIALLVGVLAGRGYSAGDYEQDEQPASGADDEPLAEAAYGE